MSLLHCATSVMAGTRGDRLTYSPSLLTYTFAHAHAYKLPTTVTVTPSQ